MLIGRAVTFKIRRGPRPSIAKTTKVGYADTQASLPAPANGDFGWNKKLVRDTQHWCPNSDTDNTQIQLQSRSDSRY